jgi:hypothetical protein
MASAERRLNLETFERLREQLATAAALCGDDQLLELADNLHEAIRRRRGVRNCDVLGWERCPSELLAELHASALQRPKENRSFAARPARPRAAEPRSFASQSA